MRTVKQNLKAFKVNMGGVVLDQALPHKKINSIDPFLLIHHWSDTLKGGKSQSEVGVGPHPHVGFAPVSFIFEGGVHHRDSKGYEGVIKKGGTQWMNSGNGIVHSERPMKELAEDGGKFEIIQFWVNAPASRKGDDANYQPLTYEETSKFVTNDDKIEVSVVAGEFGGLTGKIDTYSDLLILRFNYKEGAKMSIPVPKNYNALIYNLNGLAEVSGEKVSAKDMLELNKDGDFIEFTAQSDGRMILLSGAPINEPVATYGPFVMNTQDEIMKAMQAYQDGKMGVLTENFD